MVEDSLSPFFLSWTQKYPALAGLERAWMQQQLPHALLLTGPRETTEQFASQFAKFLLCQDESRPCGSCSSCRQFAAHIHPDVFTFDNSEIPIKTARLEELQVWMSRRAHYGQKKIYILPGLDKLSLVAANRLLKCLEEPESEILAILLAESLGGVLPTLRSRSFAYEMQSGRSFPWEDAVVHQSLLALEGEESSIAGSFEQVLQWIEAWMATPESPLLLAQQWLKIFSSVQLANGLQLLLAVFRDMIHISLGDSQNLRFPVLLERHSLERWPVQIWAQAADVVQETLRRHAAHVMPQLNVERMCICLRGVRIGV